MDTQSKRGREKDYVAGRGMTWRAKIPIMVTVTLLMSIGFTMMGLRGIVAGCTGLGCVWVFHIACFCFGVKTIPARQKARETGR